MKKRLHRQTIFYIVLIKKRKTVTVISRKVFLLMLVLIYTLIIQPSLFSLLNVFIM